MGGGPDLDILWEGSKMDAKATASPPPICLVMGPEKALSERAVRSRRSALVRNAPAAEVSETSAATYQKGDLSVLLSSSLFADEQILVVTDAERASDDFVDDFADYVKSPLPGVWVIVQHGGGNRALRVPRAIQSAGYPVVKCELLKGAKGDRQKLDLVEDEVRLADGSIEPPAAEALVAALGDSLSELLAAARQLVDDSGGHVTRETVHTFFRGRVETKPFEVANALAAGDGAGAVLLARQATSTGVAPVVLVSVLASTFRGLAKVGVPGIDSRDLGMAPWQADRARKDARRWTEDALGFAISRIARADSAVKGLSRDAEAAVELAIMDIARAFSGSR